MGKRLKGKVGIKTGDAERLSSVDVVEPTGGSVARVRGSSCSSRLGSPDTTHTLQYTCPVCCLFIINDKQTPITLLFFMISLISAAGVPFF